MTGVYRRKDGLLSFGHNPGPNRDSTANADMDTPPFRPFGPSPRSLDGNSIAALLLFIAALADAFSLHLLDAVRRVDLRLLLRDIAGYDDYW